MDKKGINMLSRGFSSDSGISREENTWVQYFSVYFKFGFFSFCCPYHLSYDEIQGKYKQASFPIQKAICGFVQMLSILVLVTNFRYIRSQDLKKNPTLYIELASLALNTWYQIGVLYIFWFKMDPFVQLLNDLRTSPLARFSRGDISRMKLLTISICTVSFAQAFVSFLYGVEDKVWDMDRILEKMAVGGKQMFFYRPDTRMTSSETFLITGLYFLASFYHQLMKNTADIVGLISVLFFRHVLYDMLHAMKDVSFTPQLLQTSYDSFKRILMKLNLAVGFFIFFFFLGPIPYYAINVVTMLDASDTFLLMSNLIYLFNYLTTIILSARVNNRTEDIKEWIVTADRFTELSPPKLDLILHDITEYELALSGYGFFSAYSGLVGTIVSLILTYAILVVQFKAEGTESEDMVGAHGNGTVGFNQVITDISTIVLMNHTYYYGN